MKLFKARGQGAIETMLILAVGMLVLLIFTVVVWENYQGSQLAQQQEIGKRVVERLVDEADNAYFFGPGTVRKLTLAIPEYADMTQSRFIGNTIILQIADSKIIGETSVEVRGSWPTEAGIFDFTITAFEDFVWISTSTGDLNFSQEQITEVVPQGQSKNVLLTVTNTSANSVDYVVSLDFSSSGSAVSMDKNGNQTFSPGVPEDFNVIISCYTTGSGPYVGSIIFAGDTNISIPINLVCSSGQDKLIIFPATRTINAVIGGLSYNVQVCNNSPNNFSSSETSVLGAASEYIFTSFSGSINADSCRTITLNTSPLAPGGEHLGVLMVKASGFTATADLNLFVPEPITVLALEGTTTQPEAGVLYGHDAYVDLVVRNNSGSVVTLNRLDINALTECIDGSGDLCNGPVQEAISINTPSDQYGGGTCWSVADPIGSTCGGCWHGLTEVCDETYSDINNITGGYQLDRNSMCVVEKASSIDLNAGEQVGLHLDRLYPDLCAESGTTRVVDLNFKFSDGNYQFVDDVVVPCSSTSGYWGAFDYFTSPDWEYFPAPLWPFHLFDSDSNATTQSPDISGGDNALSLLVKNLAREPVELLKMQIESSSPALNTKTDWNAYYMGADGLDFSCSSGSCDVAWCGSNNCGHGVFKADYNTPVAGNVWTQSSYDLNFQRKCYNEGSELNWDVNEVSGLLMDRGFWSCKEGDSNSMVFKFYSSIDGSATVTSAEKTFNYTCIVNTGYAGSGFSYLTPFCWHA